MKKRLRKKLHKGEFQEFGISLCHRDGGIVPTNRETSYNNRELTNNEIIFN